LTFNVTDTSFELRDFISHISESWPQRFRNRTFKIIEKSAQCGDDMTCACGDGDTQFSKDATSGVDTCGTVGEVFGAETVEGCERMSIGRLNGYGLDVFVSKGFEDSFGIGAIRFAANDVRVDGVGWEEDDRVPELVELASPIMGGTASLEDDGCRLSFREEAFETRAREPGVFGTTTWEIGDSDFKNRLGKINGDGCVRVHGGHLLDESGWYLDAKKRPGTL
jgi:hypothetical protein